MAAAPSLTFRSATPPYAALSTIVYQTTKDAIVLPTLNQESSDTLSFRIFNNFGLVANTAAAENINVTTYDGVGSGSRTASTSPVSMLWVHLMENMFGESLGASYYRFTSYLGFDTPVGGTQTYTPEFGSSGNSSPIIRAGANGNGWGFIEFKSYATPPAGVTAQQYLFAVVCNYTWTS